MNYSIDWDGHGERDHDTSLASGCWSAASPCNHQKSSPETICAACATAAWYAAHDRYHKASQRYNERLLLVRSERERGNWTMKLDEEYADLNAAQSAALQADNELYAVLSAPH